tara:strand:- start:10 stop:300 length:291 start_codon:yes stop_codon:yes gene_type:complete
MVADIDKDIIEDEMVAFESWNTSGVNRDICHSQNRNTHTAKECEPIDYTYSTGVAHYSDVVAWMGAANVTAEMVIYYGVVIFIYDTDRNVNKTSAH